MSAYNQFILNLTHTPQSEPIPGSFQQQNNAGGYSFVLDDWKRLERFLILGSDSGTYYVAPRKLTADSAACVERCLKADGNRTVDTIAAISVAGRAPSNDPALFALALCAGRGDTETRRLALAALPQVARTFTHLSHFTAYVTGLRGWGRGLRTAVSNWYNGLPAARLAYQAVKYGSRDGWSQRDLLRSAHPRPIDEQHNMIYHWLAKGWDSIGSEPHSDEALRLVWAYEKARRAQSLVEILPLITEYRLPWEAVDSRWRKESRLWQTLVEADALPPEAMLRQLAAMTSVEALAPLSSTTARVVSVLTDGERLKQARLHPLKILNALNTYASGHGLKGDLKWTPLPAVIDALNQAFYLAFGAVTPTHKRLYLALDISSSMWGSNIAGTALDAATASAAMALVTARVETAWHIAGFTAGPNDPVLYGRRRGTLMEPMTLSPKQRLDDVLKDMQVLSRRMGGTDCALPMLDAAARKMAVDAFIVYTDSETWANPDLHPVQALRDYRQASGIPARLIVVAMTATEFTINDPNDALGLDVVGFDTATPEVIADFVRG